MSEDFIPAAWIENHQYRATRFTYFSSNFRSHEPGVVDAALATCISLATYPLRIVGATLDKQELRKGLRLSVRYQGGEHQLTMAVDNVQIPTGDQLMLISRVTKDSTGVIDKDIERTIAAARGFLGTVFGNGFLHTHLGVSLYDHTSKKWIDDWSETEFTSDITHHHFRPVDRNGISEIHAKLRQLKSEPLKGRIEFCLPIVGRAFERNDKRLQILDYWTALEVIFNGKRRLTAYIDTCRRGTYERDTLNRLKLKRGALVHNGVLDFLSDEDVEFLRAVIMQRICTELDISGQQLLHRLDSPLTLFPKMNSDVYCSDS
jgi:hypothetical protein